MTSTFRLTLARIAVAIFIFGSWELASGVWFDPFWFSQPSSMVAELWASIKSGQFANDLWATFQAMAIGFVLGATAGLFLGLLIAQNEPVALVLRPFILGIYGIPRIALAPIFVLWFGIALPSKIWMAGVTAFLLVFFNTYEGVRSADPELRNVARVLGANRRQMFFNVLLPNASPWIIAGMRIAIPQALVAAVVAEFIASTEGLGYRMMENTNQLNTDGTMAGVIVLMIIVVLLNGVLDRVENYVLRWRPQGGGASQP